jgi:hypothetical protein
MMAQQFETIALIGIGLIGSSIARDIREKQLAGTIVVTTRSEPTLKRAGELGRVRLAQRHPARRGTPYPARGAVRMEAAHCVQCPNHGIEARLTRHHARTASMVERPWGPGSSWSTVKRRPHHDAGAVRPPRWRKAGRHKPDVVMEKHPLLHSRGRRDP